MCPYGRRTSYQKISPHPHLEGSRLKAGDEDLSQIPFSDIAGRHIVVEEKVNGANSAVSFDRDGTLLLQSRGHYLTGGWRERHYNLFKQWAGVHREALYAVLGSRYIMYGEWMYAKHTVYYDALPHYFLEFDVLDRETDPSNLMEGLYLKIEEGGGEAADRLKFVRPSFTQTGDASQTHWLDRPIIPNRLSRSIDDPFLPSLD